MTTTYPVFLEKVTRFLSEIGIQTSYRSIDAEQSFLPGLLIESGGIVIDKDKLLYPGDLLHEAAHIAVIPSSERTALQGFQIAGRKDAAAEEMMALAWSYAACIHLDIDPLMVFHEHGYKDGGSNLVENFNAGKYVGVPVLQWLGMTNTDRNSGKPLYPVMLKWLRD